MYYNRFRYYFPEEGMYVGQQDPIGLAGGHRLYSYVHDTNNWLDIFGLLPDVGGLVLAGNSTTPSQVRVGRDVFPNADGIIPSQAGLSNPMGKSAFNSPENMAKVLTDTHVHKIAPDVTLPEGLSVIADGKDVGGKMSEGHHTIFNNRDMTHSEFSEKLNSMKSENIGKIDKAGKFKCK